MNVNTQLYINYKKNKMILQRKSNKSENTTAQECTYFAYSLRRVTTLCSTYHNLLISV